MALRRSQEMMSAFSMASMTDVIFLLLIFFMVTSTFVFPTALEVNLPESSRQTALHPRLRVYVTEGGGVLFSADDEEPREVESFDNLLGLLQGATLDAVGDEGVVAVYADSAVSYGRLVEVLDVGARSNLRMVLATKPAPASVRASDGGGSAQ